MNPIINSSLSSDSMQLKPRSTSSVVIMGLSSSRRLLSIISRKHKRLEKKRICVGGSDIFTRRIPILIPYPKLYQYPEGRVPDHPTLSTQNISLLSSPSSNTPPTSNSPESRSYP